MTRSHVHIVFFVLLALSGLWSCSLDDETISSNPVLKLQFSQDTIRFDTLLSVHPTIPVQQGSITKRLKIFNKHSQAIAIDKLALSRGNNSAYSVVVNGFDIREHSEKFIEGNLVILPKDSLLILVSVAFDSNDSNSAYLIDDAIELEYNGNFEDVKLLTYGLDAHLILNDTLPCDVTWTADRPYLVYGSVTVPSSCSLTIEAGAKVFLHNDASFFVNGTLLVNGSADKKVLFRNSRFDSKFTIAPGQWDSLIFSSSSRANEIHHAIIENGRNAVYLNEGVDLLMTHSAIGHMTNNAFLLGSAKIELENVVAYNCGASLLAVEGGGDVVAEHCTFSNHENYHSRFRSSVFLSEFNGDQTGTLNVNISNSIIWGKLSNELEIDREDGSVSSIAIVNNIIRSEDRSLENDGNQISSDLDYPKFHSATLFAYYLSEESPAIDSALTSTTTLDYFGNMRDTIPDIGAFEYIAPVEK